MTPALYLLPVTLGDTPVSSVLPVLNKEVTMCIRHFIVEDVRSARRFLKKMDRDMDIDALTFYPLNKHTRPEELAGYLKPLEQGLPMGVISEAGCPAVADPGADVVAMAQRKGLKVVPLVGPSSIILSVMGSGFNGQSFAFNGYLPIEPAERIKKMHGTFVKSGTCPRQSFMVRVFMYSSAQVRLAAIHRRVCGRQLASKSSTIL